MDRLISDSMEKAELGVRIAGETSASLGEIVSGVDESNALISEIASASLATKPKRYIFSLRIHV